MSKQVAIRKWTCSQHDYPDHCEECDTWHCEECRTKAKWRTVGWRDASPLEEVLFAIPKGPLYPTRNVFLDAIGREDFQGGKVTIPLIIP